MSYDVSGRQTSKEKENIFSYFCEEKKKRKENKNKKNKK